MFWGLIMEPGHCYSQSVKTSFHISMAALDLTSCTDDPCQVMCLFEGRNYLLCTLDKNGKWQCALDLNFEAGTKVSFASNGGSHIHLSGYLLAEDDLYDGLEEESEEEQMGEKQMKKKKKVEDSCEAPPKKKQKNEKSTSITSSFNIPEDIGEEESSDSDFDITKVLDGNVEEEEEEEEDVEEEEEDEEGMNHEVEDELEDEDEEAEDNETDEEESDNSEGDSEDEEEEIIKPKQNGIEKKTSRKSYEISKVAQKVERTPKKHEQQKTEKAVKKNESLQRVEKSPKRSEQLQQQKKTSKKQVLKGGIQVEDIKDGNGEIAKHGKFVYVYYEGRLKSNNKVFDSANKGPGFSFRLGKNEVIKGWDIGLVGMKVGGKRRLTIPASMAYGQKGSPPVIPPNSTLVFDVELKKIS